MASSITAFSRQSKHMNVQFCTFFFRKVASYGMLAWVVGVILHTAVLDTAQRRAALIAVSPVDCTLKVYSPFEF